MVWLAFSRGEDRWTKPSQIYSTRSIMDCSLGWTYRSKKIPCSAHFMEIHASPCWSRTLTKSRSPKPPLLRKKATDHKLAASFTLEPCCHPQRKLARMEQQAKHLQSNEK